MDETWTLSVPAFTILTTDNPSFSVLLFYSRHGIDARHGIPRLGHDRDPGRAGSVSGIPGSHPFLHVLELCSWHSRDRCPQTGAAEDSEMCGAAVPVTLVVFAVIYCLMTGANWIPFTAYSLVVGLTAVVERWMIGSSCGEYSSLF